MALLRLTPMLRTPSTFFHQVARLHNIERTKIGKRGVVDYTNLGMYSYVDHAAFPMPAVRRKDNSPEVMVWMKCILRALLCILSRFQLIDVDLVWIRLDVKYSWVNKLDRVVPHTLMGAGGSIKRRGSAFLRAKQSRGRFLKIVAVFW